MDSVDNIHRYWYHGNKQCDGCPRRDEDQVLSPHYGQGSVPADVAIIAQAPGGTAISDADGRPIGDGERTWKNYSDAEHDGASESSPDGFEVTPIEEVGNYKKEIKVFVEALHEVFNDEFGQDANLYLTQHTKCEDIHTEGFDPKTDQGLDRCPQYLIEELEIADPDVVIVMGGKPDNHLHQALADIGVPDDLPKNVGDVVFDIDDNLRVKTYESTEIDPTVLASYHWTWRAMYSMRDYCDIDDNSTYTQLLAQEAANHVDV